MSQKWPTDHVEDVTEMVHGVLALFLHNSSMLVVSEMEWKQQIVYKCTKSGKE